MMTAGQMLLGIAAGHTVLGLVAERGPLADIVGDGVIGAVEGLDPRLPEREVAFWFLVTGAGLGLAGGLARAIERDGRDLPPWFGWGLAGLGLAGGAAMPASGFWTLLAPAARVLVRPRR